MKKFLQESPWHGILGQALWITIRIPRTPLEPRHCQAVAQSKPSSACLIARPATDPFKPLLPVHTAASSPLARAQQPPAKPAQQTLAGSVRKRDGLAVVQRSAHRG